MKPKPIHPLLALICNLVLLYLLYFLCRVVYLCEFWDLYSEGWSQLSIGQLLWGGFRFDTAAICYTNIPYFLMMFLPLSPRIRGSRWWSITTKALFVVANTFALWLNLFDTVYSRYTGRRTTSSFFAEFSSEGNLGSIFFTELLNHWYLVLLGLTMLAAILFLYRTPASQFASRHRTHYLLASLYTFAAFFLSTAGIRGGFSYHRPLSLADANGYVCRPKEAPLVLNTPFSLIRTIGKTTFTDPKYYTPEELDLIYSPIHSDYSTNQSSIKKNVVILILESFGEEFWGFYNDGCGYTPFLDSLARQSLTFRRSYANGRKSIDALPSVLCGIPMLVEPFILTRYANNETGSIASSLAGMGYRTAFFHGADNASMGFRSFSQSIGFQDYYGMDEYCLDSRFGGHDDFDGYWAIWDEEFLQYFALMLDTLSQPFCASLFTATSHHPFNVPQRYQAQFQGGTLPIYRTIQYSDHALQHFFSTASRMPWYQNTLFVITADHTNDGEKPEYKTDLGLFRVPILIFDPSGQIPRGISPSTAQQTDIMPTILNLLGYPHPYMAYGIDLLSTPPDSTWALSYSNGAYQYVRNDRLLLFDGQKVVGLYNIATDSLLLHNLLTPGEEPHHVNHLKALIQSYMQRMINNNLVMPDPSRTSIK